MALKKIQGKITNPFVNGIIIPDELFCDRVTETAQIISLIQGGDNIVLKAPRRIGKSSLINHVFCQNEIRDKYNILYLDLLGTNNSHEFLQTFERALIKANVALKEKIAGFVRTLPERIYLEHETDFLKQRDSHRIGLKEFNGLLFNLEEIFDCLENTQKPNIVVFDEFQQIKYYPEPMTAILRSYVQKQTNSRFIFSGSSRRMLTTMFTAKNEPFCESAEAIDLDIISKESYSDFCKNKFRDYGKDITDDAVEFTYFLACGNTYELQRIMRQTFSELPDGETADRESIENAVVRILERNDQTYREKITLLNNTKERNVFIAIALEGVASEVMSKDFIKYYNLGAVSSISQSLEKLCSEEKLNLTMRIGNSYKLQDKMFELWIANQCGILNTKFALAEEQFLKEREALTQIRLMKLTKKKSCPPKNPIG